VHVYVNHSDAIKTQLGRTAKPYPKLKINRTVESIDDFKMEDFELVGYDPEPFIKAPMAV